MRLLHILPIIVIIAAVTAGLKAEDQKAFRREFLKAGGSLLGGFVGLGLVFFVLGRLL